MKENVSILSSATTDSIPRVTINEAKSILRTLIDDISDVDSQGIFLWGPPGVGKSALVKQLAKELNRGIVDLRLPLLDPVDLRGLPVTDKEQHQAIWLPPDFLPKENSKPGILFLDEINAAPPAIQASAYQLILDKRVGTYKLPKDWVVVAAGNRVTDRSVAYRLPSALSNRFTHLEIDPQIDEWVTWAWETTIDPFIISFLRLQPHLLMQFDPRKNQTAFPSPRSWSFSSKLAKLRDENLPLYINTLQGTIGNAAAQQFLAFINYRDELPNPKDILEGRPYEIPTQIDAQYVLMGGLIRELMNGLNDDKISNFFAYVNQFENTTYSDHAIVLIKETLNAIKSVKQKDTFMSHREFESWLTRNANFLT